MAVAGLAAGLSVIGTIGGIVGTVVQYSASKKAEEARKKQMELEAARARREQVRRSQVASASAKAAAYNQGAGTTSALAGGVSQIQQEAGRNVQATSQDETLGGRIFAANAQAAFGGLISSLGQGVSNLGTSVSNASGTLTRLGYSNKIPFVG